MRELPVIRQLLTDTRQITAAARWKLLQHQKQKENA